MKKIGVIGAGNMGGALIKGWSTLDGVSIIAYDINKDRLSEVVNNYGVEKAEDIEQAIKGSNIVLLAVKPNQVKGLLERYKDCFNTKQIIVSICAGIKIKKIGKWSNDRCKVVRIMPNTPALVDRGMFAICFGDGILEEDRGLILSLFSSLGKVFEMEEKYMDAYTALIGSGPAYIIYFLEALVESGVSMGFPRDMSIEMVKGLLSGTTKMVEEIDMKLSEFREMVTSPGGTTIAALNHFDRMAFRGIIIDAVEKACKRSKELA